MERFDATRRLLLQIGPGGPEQTITLATREPQWPSSSLQYRSQNMAYFVLLSGEGEVCCSSLTKTTPTCAPPRWTRLDLTRCFFAFAFACEMDGSFGMQEGAWFG